MSIQNPQDLIILSAARSGRGTENWKVLLFTEDSLLTGPGGGRYDRRISFTDIQSMELRLPAGQLQLWMRRMGGGLVGPASGGRFRIRTGSELLELEAELHTAFQREALLSLLKRLYAAGLPLRETGVAGNLHFLLRPCDEATREAGIQKLTSHPDGG